MVGPMGAGRNFAGFPPGLLLKRKARLEVQRMFQAHEFLITPADQTLVDLAESQGCHC